MKLIATTARNLLAKPLSRQSLNSHPLRCVSTVSNTNVSGGDENKTTSWPDILSDTSSDINIAKLFMPAEKPSFSNQSKKQNHNVGGDLMYSLSFASPESDFTSQQLTDIMREQLSRTKVLHQRAEKKSTELNPSTPSSHLQDILSDSSADLAIAKIFMPVEKSSLSNQSEKQNHNVGGELMYSLSFASPESDFTSQQLTDVMREQLSLTKVLQKRVEKKSIQKSSLSNQSEENHNVGGELMYSLSFASPESDFTSEQLTDVMRQQLSRTKVLQKRVAHTMELEPSTVMDSPLPRSFDEALSPSSQARVVTSTVAPFRIVHVNSAWEELCGFTKEESIGKTLGCLQGQETDVAGVTALINQMMNGEEAGCELVNYDKEGRRFRNRLRVGSLRKPDGGEVTHFVGVLKEMKM